MITIFADASHCPRTNAAGWGAWAKATGWPQGSSFGGPIRSTVLNSGEAEIAALTNAVIRAHNRGWLTDIPGVMLQSDSLRTLQLVLQATPNASPSDHKDGAKIVAQKLLPSPFEEKALTIITEVLLTIPTVLLRHVKGHREGNGRNWVNRTCDDIAKKHMAVERAKRGGGGSSNKSRRRKRKKIA
jgi:ribonuclease HI